MTRRDWLAWFGALVPATTWIACTGPRGGLPDAASSDAPAGFLEVEIVDNHVHAPHVLMIAMQDALDSIRDGQPRNYGMRGAASHDHMVTFTSADFQMLIQQSQVVTESSTVTLCHFHPIKLTPPA